MPSKYIISAVVATGMLFNTTSRKKSMVRKSSRRVVEIAIFLLFQGMMVRTRVIKLKRQKQMRKSLIRSIEAMAAGSTNSVFLIRAEIPPVMIS